MKDTLSRGNTRVFILFGALAACATANAAPDARNAIVQLEHRWMTALQRHDSSALERILAQDFVDVSPQGTFRTRAAALAGANAPAGSVQTIHDLHVRLYGNVAIANGVNQVHSTTQGWTVEIPFTDVFARRRGIWQAVSAQETLRKPPSTPAAHR